jgi:protein CWC15
MSAIPVVKRKKRASEIRDILKGAVKEEPKEEDAQETEEEELLRELAKIKAEKAERKLVEEKTDIFGATAKSWREDAVFQKGEARSSEISSKKSGNLYNDMMKSEFHRKFLDRYVAKLNFRVH